MEPCLARRTDSCGVPTPPDGRSEVPRSGARDGRFTAAALLLIIAVVAAVALARRPEGADVDADYVQSIEAAEAAEAEAKASADAAVEELAEEEAAAEAEESEEVSS